MVCWARCSRSRTNVWFIAPPARAGRCHTELYDRTPRRFKVIQGPNSNTHATSRGSSTTGNWNASAPPSAHSVKISDIERAGCRRLPRADLDEQRGRSRIVSDDRARGGTERDATPAGSVGDMAASGHTGAPVPGRSPRRTDTRRARHASPLPYSDRSRARAREGHEAFEGGVDYDESSRLLLHYVMPAVLRIMVSIM